MAAIILPRKWQTQPQGPTELHQDWAAKGLSFVRFGYQWGGANSDSLIATPQGLAGRIYADTARTTTFAPFAGGNSFWLDFTPQTLIGSSYHYMGYCSNGTYRGGIAYFHANSTPANYPAIYNGSAVSGSWPNPAGLRRNNLSTYTPTGAGTVTCYGSQDGSAEVTIGTMAQTTDTFQFRDLANLGADYAIRTALGFTGYRLTNNDTAALWENPNCIFKPRKQVLYFTTAGGPTNQDLTVVDSTHAHSPANVALTSASLLTVTTVAHEHAAANVTLSASGAATLTLTEATHAHAVDSIALSSAYYLGVVDSTHAHVVDPVALDNTGSAVLSLVDSTHAHSVANIVLSSASALAIVDTIHANIADSVTLSTVTQSSLAVVDALHVHVAADVALSIPGAMTLTADDIAAIADAVWAKTLVGTIPASMMIRIALASLAGKREGLGTATEYYYDLDGITARVTFSPTDNAGNGVPSLDVS